MAANLSDTALANWLIGPQLVGAIFILAALIQKQFPPKKINSLYGYRTPLSMKNQQNWDEGNRYSAKLMLKLGFFLLVVGLILTPLISLIPMGLDAQMLIKTGLIVAGAMGSVVILLTSTERHLEKTTDTKA
ncbi:SdpI family protein [Mucilaginibacter achroorhodeus]|uniref:SdpI family protein n=1 Tax=Mucilaginibacter achroorhodeus TaxID=2599294 RepID=A0A563TXJ1_9SPHI|nr:SdpI family protein [Mucilaginibacter achroorhodeus]TWR24088.1 SdpI family protein [Mucilaginibacter achroorhodeus]